MKVSTVKSRMLDFADLQTDICVLLRLNRKQVIVNDKAKLYCDSFLMQLNSVVINERFKLQRLISHYPVRSLTDIQH